MSPACPQIGFGLITSWSWTTSCNSSRSAGSDNLKRVESSKISMSTPSLIRLLISAGAPLWSRSMMVALPPSFSTEVTAARHSQVFPLSVSAYAERGGNVIAGPLLTVAVTSSQLLSVRRGKEIAVADAGVGLAKAIWALRAELVEAINAGAGDWMRFSLDPIELTLQVVVTKDVDGKIGWKILEVGGEYQSEVTQTVKLTLKPVWYGPDGTSTTNFTIAGDQPEGVSFGRDSS
jgi:hypothetical protein